MARPGRLTLRMLMPMLAKTPWRDINLFQFFSSGAEARLSVSPPSLSWAGSSWDSSILLMIVASYSLSSSLSSASGIFPMKVGMIQSI